MSSVQAQACSIKVEIIDQSDVTKLKGIVAGPPDTPFEGENTFLCHHPMLHTVFLPLDAALNNHHP